jgi:hypothetical protein
VPTPAPTSPPPPPPPIPDWAMSCLRSCYLKFNSFSCESVGGWWRPGLGPWNMTDNINGQNLAYHGIYSTCQQCSKQSLQPKMFTQSLMIQCESCGAGRYYAGGTARSTSSGTFVGDNMTCHSCPPGKISGGSAPRCRSCPHGKVVVSGSQECQQCPDGTYATHDGVCRHD